MNIVLTGFMATGKSEVGKELARLLEMEFVDTDDLIEEKSEMKIPEIFAKKGEKYFRDVESQIAKEVGSYDNYVIATGGGIVLRQENIKALKKNGKIINLTTSVEKILCRVSKSFGRPLLNVKDKKAEIEKLLAERKPYYKKCDFSFDTTETTSVEAAKKIIKKLEWIGNMQSRIWRLCRL
ncbi:MAG TPA: shikimate kinase [Elusimicrobia bacterium]|nr:shikimate kinase [Elusimicrobiota bacterium]